MSYVNEDVQRLTERVAALDAEIAQLTEEAHERADAWQAAVTSGEPKPEAAALKALDATRAALTSAMARKPLLAEALAEAQRNSVPLAFEALKADLAKLDAEMVQRATAAFEAHAKGLTDSDKVYRLSKERSDRARAFRDYARAAGVDVNGWQIDTEPVVLAEFSVLYKDFLFNTPNRFKPSLGKILRVHVKRGAA